MSKKWIDFKIQDVRKCIERLPEDQRDDFRLKPINKRQKDVLMFTPKDFKKYRENESAVIVGKIRKRQRRYKTFESPAVFPPKDTESWQKKKQDQKKIGYAELHMPENVKGKDVFQVGSDFVKIYDAKESGNSHVVGYAYVGDNKFLEVTTFNPLLLLIPIFLALIVLIVFHSCQDQGDGSNGSVLDIMRGHKIENSTTQKTEQLPNCDYLLFEENTTLTKENQGIRLCNLASNEGKWYISYQVYIDGKPLMDINDSSKQYETGAIKPGYQISWKDDQNLNLWSRLPAGEHELIAVGTQYQLKANEKGEHLVTPIHNKLKTNLIIKK